MINESICNQAFVAIRSEPSEKAEMVTQVLFGETFKVLEYDENWAKIQLDFDGYIGWMNSKSIASLPEREISLWKKSETWVVSPLQVKLILEPYKQSMIVAAGSSFAFNSNDRNSFVIANVEYYISSGVNMSRKNVSLQDVAMSFINTPYLWGGRTVFGIDCSGFVQTVYKILGKTLPRDASAQIEMGETINFVEEAQPGDLAFFDNAEGVISHVGLFMGKGEIIHASGKVRVDRIDHQGIFNQELKIYSHKLRVIKRIGFNNDIHL